MCILKWGVESDFELLAQIKEWGAHNKRGNVKSKPELPTQIEKYGFER